MDGTLNLSTDTLKVMLVSSLYTADKDHTYVDMGGSYDPADAELSGTGYVKGWGGSGRKTLTNVSLTLDNANDRVILDADDVVWNSINAGTASAAIVIKEGASNDTDSLLIAYFDSGFPVVTNGSDFTLKWSDSGVILGKSE